MRGNKTKTPWLLAGIIAPLLVVGALLGILVGSEQALERVPVALVNNDELITEIGDDGEEEVIFASKPLVTALVSNEETSLNWVVTNQEEALALLQSGQVYAIVEIPENFSDAVLTLDDPEPQAAQFTIRTDPSHSYLAGVLADLIGESISLTVSDEFGREITSGLFTAIVDLSAGVTDAAEAAREVSDGVDELSDGVSEVADGTTELRTGTRDLADGYAEFDDGVGEYLDGVRALSDGLEEFNTETKALPELSAGISQYTGGVSQVSGGLNQLNDAGVFNGIADPEQTTLQTLIATLTQLANGGATLSGQTTTAISGVRTGIVEVDKGADALAEASYDLESGSAELRSGIGDLADGVEELDRGVQELDDGVIELRDGMREFADGLEEGAQEIDEQGITEPSEQTLDTLITPVGFDPQDRTGEVGLAQTLGSVLVPLGLWFAVLMYFLITPAPSRRSLAGTVSTTRIAAAQLAPAGLVAALHTVLGVLMLHTFAGVDWALVGLTLPTVALGVASFFALHMALWWWTPRFLGAISVALGLVQIVTLGVLIPAEVLPNFYQAINGLTPLGWFADALLAAVASGGAERITAGLLALSSLGAVSLALGVWGLSRRRRNTTKRLLGLAA